MTDYRSKIKAFASSGQKPKDLAQDRRIQEEFTNIVMH